MFGNKWRDDEIRRLRGKLWELETVTELFDISVPVYHDICKRHIYGFNQPDLLVFEITRNDVKGLTSDIIAEEKKFSKVIKAVNKANAEAHKLGLNES